MLQGENVIAAYTKEMEAKVIEIAEGAPEYRVDPNKTLLLVIDLINDGNRNEGFAGKVGFDVSMEQKIEPVVAKLVNRARQAGVEACYVQCIYDFGYLLPNMREQFEMVRLPEGMCNKGTWGAEFVDTLPKPDLWLVKSHFSSFSPHTFLFNPSLHPEIVEYLSLPAEKDDELKKMKKKTLYDYFLEAQAHSAVANPTNIEKIMDIGVVSLDAYLKARGIDTIIITGASTHVCVDAAVCGAAERGYRLLLPVDAIAGEDHDKHWCYLHNHASFKARPLTSDKIIF